MTGTGQSSKVSAAGTDDLGLQQAVSGKLEDLLEEHRKQINEGTVLPYLPFMFFRVGPNTTPSENWYYALLNKDFVAQKEQLLEDYRRGNSMDVVDPKILNKTLKEMLIEYVGRMDTSNVPDSHKVAFETVKNTIFENDVPEPRMARPNKTTVIEYNLQPNPNKASQVDLTRTVADSLSYIQIDNGPNKYGAITVDLCYSMHSQGGEQ